MKRRWMASFSSRKRSVVHVAVLMAAVMLGSTVAARAAHAQEEDEGPPSRTALASGYFAMNLLSMPTVAITLGGEEGVPVFGLGLAATAAGSLTFYQSREPAIPLAANGAIWGGMAGLLAGATIDGVYPDNGVRLGPWAYGLAGVGALAGGWLGATQVEPGEPSYPWLLVPAAGAVAGAITPRLTEIVLCLPAARAAARAGGGCLMSRRVGLEVTRWSTIAGIATGMAVGIAYSRDHARSRERENDATPPATFMFLPPVQF
jgi:hypothetical protein